MVGSLQFKQLKPKQVQGVRKVRNVYLFPDLSKDGKAFELWSNKANDIQKRLQGTYFHVSDLLEQLAPQQDKEQGKDIADYLIKQDWRLFRKQESHSPNLNQLKPQPVKKVKNVKPYKKLFFRSLNLQVEVFNLNLIKRNPKTGVMILQNSRTTLKYQTTNPTRKAEQVQHNK